MSERSHRVRPERSPGPELSVVIPTFNERGNVTELARRLDARLTGIR
jgi:dolichol-phosphate mannosyltransferase